MTVTLNLSCQFCLSITSRVAKDTMGTWYKVHAESTGMRHTFCNNINTLFLMISVFTYTIHAWSCCPSWTERVLNLLAYLIKVLILIKTFQVIGIWQGTTFVFSDNLLGDSSSPICFPFCKSQNRGLKYLLCDYPLKKSWSTKLYIYILSGQGKLSFVYVSIKSILLSQTWRWG